MPAAAVIPAPIAYIKVVAVKKLVVGFLVWRAWPVAARLRVLMCAHHPCYDGGWAFTGLVDQPSSIFYFEKIRVFKASNCSEYISME